MSHKSYQSIMFAILTFAFIIGVTPKGHADFGAIQVRTKNCSSEMKRRLRFSASHALDRVPEMRSRVDDLLSFSTWGEAERKMRKAKWVLKCARKKLYKVYYQCEPGDDGKLRVARTSWIFGKKVKIYESRALRLNTAQLAAVLVHEATHKCGTDDIAYYGDRTGEHPNDDAHLEWQNTASIYDWWYLRGVCVPGFNC